MDSLVANATSSGPEDVGEQRDNDKAENEHGEMFTNQLRNCCIRYYEFYRYTLENGGNEAKCHKFAEAYRALCPYEWVNKWDEERELGLFPQPI